MTQDQTGATPDEPRSRRYGYFVLQASTGQAEGQVSGVLEDLTTGEKQAFGSTTEIARLLDAWATPGPGRRSSGSNPEEGS